MPLWLNGNDPAMENAIPTYQPTPGCTVGHVVQLGKHTQTHAQVSRLPNEHTSQSLEGSVAFHGRGLHVIAKQTFSVP